MSRLLGFRHGTCMGFSLARIRGGSGVVVVGGAREVRVGRAVAVVVVVVVVLVVVVVVVAGNGLLVVLVQSGGCGLVVCRVGLLL